MVEINFTERLSGSQYILWPKISWSCWYGSSFWVALGPNSWWMREFSWASTMGRCSGKRLLSSIDFSNLKKSATRKFLILWRVNEFFQRFRHQMKIESFFTRGSVPGGNVISQSATSWRLAPVTVRLSQTWSRAATQLESEFMLMRFLTICVEEVKI